MNELIVTIMVSIIIGIIGGVSGTIIADKGEVLYYLLEDANNLINKYKEKRSFKLHEKENAKTRKEFEEWLNSPIEEWE